MLRTLIFCFALLVAPSLLGAKTIDVYLLGGQSNMQGVGKIAELPVDVPRQIPDTLFWNGKSFEPLVLGKTKVSARVGEFGPEVGFALDTAKKERPICLIKHHASGMPLHHGWNAGKWMGNEPGPGRVNFYPGEKPNDPNQGVLYQRMLGQYRAGLAALEKAGHQPIVRGFVWMQGEQDAKHETSATQYDESLARLQKRLVEDLKLSAPLPVVFGQVLPHEPALPRFTHRTEIRQTMAAADAASGKPEAIPQVKMVSTDGFPLLPDTVHYSAAGQLQLGKAFATAMKELQDTK